MRLKKCFGIFSVLILFVFLSTQIVCSYEGEEIPEMPETPGSVHCGATAPACDGDCPTGEFCELENSVCVCNTVEVEDPEIPELEVPCGLTVAPACNGICPTDQTCHEDDNGLCTCNGSAITLCGDTAPLCNGVCSAGLTCVGPHPFTGDCTCADAGEPEGPIDCGVATAPSCNGECSDPDDTCVVEVDLFGNQTCVCMGYDPNLCENSAAPACGGHCPDDFICQPGMDGGTNICQCVLVELPEGLTPCGDSAPACDGECPVDEHCAESSLIPGTCACEGETLLEPEDPEEEPEEEESDPF